MQKVQTTFIGLQGLTLIIPSALLAVVWASSLGLSKGSVEHLLYTQSQ